MPIGYLNFHLLLRNKILKSKAQKKTTPLEASLKKNERLVYSNLGEYREIQKPKYKLGRLVGTADNKSF